MGVNVAPARQGLKLHGTSTAPYISDYSDPALLELARVLLGPNAFVHKNGATATNDRAASLKSR